MIFADVVVSDEMVGVIKEAISLCWKVIAGLISTATFVLVFILRIYIRQYNKSSDTHTKSTEKNTEAINGLQEALVTMNMEMREANSRHQTELKEFKILHEAHLEDHREQKKITELHGKQINKINYKLGIEYE